MDLRRKVAMAILGEARGQRSGRLHIPLGRLAYLVYGNERVAPHMLVELKKAAASLPGVKVVDVAKFYNPETNEVVVEKKRWRHHITVSLPEFLQGVYAWRRTRVG